MNRLSIKLVLLSTGIILVTLAVASSLTPVGALVFELVGASLAGAISYLAYYVHKDE